MQKISTLCWIGINLSKNIFIKEYQMRITDDDVKKIARLSRLKIDDTQCQSYQQELDAILDFVAQLDAVDTSDANVTQSVARQELRLRDDMAIEQKIPEDVLKNSAHSLMIGEGGVYVVPKVVE